MRTTLLQTKELSILLVTVAVAIYFTVTSPAFNTTDNYHTIAQYFTPWAIVAAGEVLLLICGESTSPPASCSPCPRSS